MGSDGGRPVWFRYRSFPASSASRRELGPSPPAEARPLRAQSQQRLQSVRLLLSFLHDLFLLYDLFKIQLGVSAADLLGVFDVFGTLQ